MSKRIPRQRRRRKPVKADSPLVRHVGRTVERWLAHQKLSKSAAAKLFNQPESYMNNRVRGLNMTIRSLERLFQTMGGHVVIRVKGKDGLYV